MGLLLLRLDLTSIPLKERIIIMTHKISIKIYPLKTLDIIMNMLANPLGPEKATNRPRELMGWEISFLLKTEKRNQGEWLIIIQEQDSGFQPWI